MSVRIADEVIHLDGRCLVEDAETLLVAIQQNPGMPVDLGGVQRLHMAVAQVLLVLRPPVGRPPADIFLQRVFGPLFDSDKAAKPD